MSALAGLSPGLWVEGPRASEPWKSASWNFGRVRVTPRWSPALSSRGGRPRRIPRSPSGQNPARSLQRGGQPGAQGRFHGGRGLDDFAAVGLAPGTPPPEVLGNRPPKARRRPFRSDRDPSGRVAERISPAMGPEGDEEVARLAARSLLAIGLEDSVLELGHWALVGPLLEHIPWPAEGRQALEQALNRKSVPALDLLGERHGAAPSGLCSRIWCTSEDVRRRVDARPGPPRRRSVRHLG